MLNKYNFLATKYAAKEGSSPELEGIFVTPEKTVATDRFTLLEITNPQNQLENFPSIPGYINSEIQAHIMPIESARQIEANLKKIKSKTLPIMENAVAIGTDDNKGFITTNLETASPVIYKEVEGQFPKYENIIPKGEPLATVKLNPKYLKRLADTFSSIGNDEVVICIYDSRSPVKLSATTDKGQNVTGLIMPLLN